MFETSLRTHTCGELDAKSKGKQVKLCGWVHARRDHGGLTFIDVRDFYGMTQVVFRPEKKDLFSKAGGLRKEFVIQVEGEVKARPKGMENRDIRTGLVEVDASKMAIINKAKPVPFPIEDRITANDDVRLRYRFLDLRRGVMQRNLVSRDKVTQAVREYMSRNGFVEIETPMMVRATPEGARDYVVPSRVNPGKFYALPQSPQLYKQILMVSGFDRYFQIARCLRDEDLRQDRQPEHTQVDLEMSFSDREDIMEMVEGLYGFVVRKAKGIDLPKFPRLGYREAMDRYGSDKPDLRFGLELADVSHIVKKSDFNIFRDAVAQGGVVKALFVEGEFGKKDVKAFEEICKDAGARGLVSVRFDGDKLSESHAAEPLQGVAKELAKAGGPGKSAADAAGKSGWMFMVAGKWKTACAAMGRLRLEIANMLNLIKNGEELRFCWVTDFPLFAWNDEEKKWEPEHHIFSMPKDEHIQYLEKEPGRVEGKLFDIVLNGAELGSGSVRISNPELQERVMAVIGMTKEDARSRFGFLLDAYDYGGPIHGGMGLGLDRLVAMLNGCSDIREVIAFPKNKAAQCPMDGSPSDVDPKQLKELHIRVDIDKKPGKEKGKK